MLTFKWDDCFKVGIGEFDDHHKHLFDLLNKTFDAFTTGASHDALSEILRELVDYAVSHFYAEECWMEAVNYPGLLEQKAEHRKFTAKACEFQKAFIDGKEVAVLDVLQFLESWLMNHILKSDAEDRNRDTP